METRLVAQCKVFKLHAHYLKNPSEDYATIAALAYNEGQLEKLIEEEKCEPYTETEVRGDNVVEITKTFRKGGPLEWFGYDPENKETHRIDHEWLFPSMLEQFLKSNPSITLLEEEPA